MQDIIVPSANQGIIAINVLPCLLLAMCEGLDGRAASIVARVLKNVSAEGCAVVCTIHQPKATIFAAFDELLLLNM